MGSHYQVLSYLVVTKTLNLTNDSERSTLWRQLICKLPYLDSRANGGEALELASLESCYKERKSKYGDDDSKPNSKTKSIADLGDP